MRRLTSLCFVLCCIPVASQAGLMTTQTCMADLQALKAQCQVNRIEAVQGQKDSSQAALDALKAASQVALENQKAADQVALENQKTADQAVIDRAVQNAQSSKWIFGGGGALLGLVIGLLLGRSRRG